MAPVKNQINSDIGNVITKSSLLGHMDIIKGNPSPL